MKIRENLGLYTTKDGAAFRATITIDTDEKGLRGLIGRAIKSPRKRTQIANGGIIITVEPANP